VVAVAALYRLAVHHDVHAAVTVESDLAVHHDASAFHGAVAAAAVESAAVHLDVRTVG
jgi:hypothetical protein